MEARISLVGAVVIAFSLDACASADNEGHATSRYDDAASLPDRSAPVADDASGEASTFEADTGDAASEMDGIVCEFARWGSEGHATVVPLDLLCADENCPWFLDGQQGSTPLQQMESVMQCRPAADAAPEALTQWTRTAGCDRVIFYTPRGFHARLYVYDVTTGELVGAAREDDVGVPVGNYPCLNAAYVAGEWDVACEERTVELCDACCGATFGDI